MAWLTRTWLVATLVIYKLEQVAQAIALGGFSRATFVSIAPSFLCSKSPPRPLVQVPFFDFSTLLRGQPKWSCVSLSRRPIMSCRQGPFSSSKP